MKITIQKTMYLDEVPEEIDESFSTIGDRCLRRVREIERCAIYDRQMLGRTAVSHALIREDTNRFSISRTGDGR